MLDFTLITIELEAMQRDLQNNEVISYQTKYNYLFTHTPTLFELLYKSKDIDIDQLKFMISQAEKIKKKEITQHDADVTIGQKLADTYITPVVEKN